MNRIPRGGPVVRAGRSPARGDHAPSARDHPRRGRPRHRVDQVEDAHLRLRGEHRQLQPREERRQPSVPPRRGDPGRASRLQGDGKLVRTMRFADLESVVAPGATGRRTGRDAPEEPRLEPSARGAQAASAAALADDAFPGGRDPWNPFRREERAAVDLADGAAAGLDDGVGPDDLQVQQQSGTTGYRTQAAA